MKIRIRFKKEGTMKFIGHLDMMRYFQKVFRRADVDIEYSQGFSPHQLISFASPLGVGLTSEGEYMDIFVHSCDDSKTMVERINQHMVEGVSVLSFKQILDETKNSNAMSLIAAADYIVSFREGRCPDSLNEAAVLQFMSLNEIVVTKKTKKSVANTDIKPMIHSLAFENGQLKMRVATGSAANLKPELLVSALYRMMGLELNEFELCIHRLDMFAKDSQTGGFISLDDLGADISGKR